jgi:hypothetical protein
MSFLRDLMVFFSVLILKRAGIRRKVKDKTVMFQSKFLVETITFTNNDYITLMINSSGDKVINQSTAEKIL